MSASPDAQARKADAQRAAGASPAPLHKGGALMGMTHNTKQEDYKMEKNTALMELPRCPVHNTPMEYRPARTREQSFCGTWYDCTTPGCTCSVLLPSAELAAMYDRNDGTNRKII